MGEYECGPDLYREMYGDPRSDGRIITQSDLMVAVLEVLDRELTPNLPIAVMFELNVETREPGKCFVDVGLVPQVPKTRWKRLMQRIGLWFLRRAEEWNDAGV